LEKWIGYFSIGCKTEGKIEYQAEMKNSRIITKEQTLNYGNLMVYKTEECIENLKRSTSYLEENTKYIELLKNHCKNCSLKSFQTAFDDLDIDNCEDIVDKNKAKDKKDLHSTCRVKYTLDKLLEDGDTNNTLISLKYVPGFFNVVTNSKNSDAVKATVTQDKIDLFEKYKNGEIINEK